MEKALDKFGKTVKKIEENKPLWMMIDTILGIIIVVAFVVGAIKIFG